MKIRTPALVLLAGACLSLTLLNASWIAPKPAGELAVIAHRGIVQPEDPAPDGCPARHVPGSALECRHNDTTCSKRGPAALPM